ncbi:MAG TPA: PfkB family carbohydrate kinase, partial [Actinomycetota bacterium]
MTSLRVAIVGHVEWVEFVRVDRVPSAGEIAHGLEGWEEAGGGGGVSAVQLAMLAGSSTLFTALGDDEVAGKARRSLEGSGVRVEAASRGGPTRRAITMLDDLGERTIITVGHRLSPTGSDALPWDDLGAADGVFFTAGDEEALRAARRARVLVATSRVLEEIRRWRVPIDVLVGSARDPRETFDVGDLDAPPRLAVLTEGARGGRCWTPDEGWSRYEAAPLPGPGGDAYGAGDSFAAGLTYGLAKGLAPEAALAVAARCGAAARARTGVSGR